MNYIIYCMCRKVWGSILVTTIHLPLPQNILISTVAHPAPQSEGTVSSFPRVYRQGRRTDNSLPSSADIVNVWSNNSTPPYAFTACRKINCTLLMLSL
jgi:hypothetical protein